MKRVFLVAVLVLGCGTKESGADGDPSSTSGFRAPKPHNKVDGAAMYRIDVEEISYQRVDAQGKPTGEPRTVAADRGGEMRCRIEKDPGSEAISTWFTRSIADTGGFIDPKEQDQSTDPEVIDCVVNSVINMKFDGGTGRYKVTAKAWFSSPQKQ